MLLAARVRGTGERYDDPGRAEAAELSAGVHLLSELFSGIVPRGGQSVRVVGSGCEFPGGSWQGSFAYAQEIAVLNGTATLHTDTKETWIVDITDAGTSLGGDYRSACFRILEGRS
jgi:hypothetical protein